MWPSIAFKVIHRYMENDVHAFLDNLASKTFDIWGHTSFYEKILSSL